MKKKILAFLLLSALLLSGCSGGNNASAPAEDEPADNGSAAQQDNTDAAEPTGAVGKHNAEIVIKNYGTIKVELDGDAAPLSVQNFIDLANDGFYDGLTFHRIINGFMMQGGDPNGDGTGGSDKTIKGEFTANGVENTLSHTRGAISMARAQDMDSASSQFFIVHQDSDFLDGQYACFGYVTEGMEVVDDICTNVPVTDQNGTVPKENQPVIESVKILD